MPKIKPKGGRPSKWTPEIALRLGGAFKNAYSVGDAARKAGIGKSTLHRWRRAALAGDARFAALLPLFEQLEERWPFPW